MAFELINGAQFLHIPKTGGNWVEQVLRDNGLLARKQGHRHATYDQVILNVAGGNSGVENLREALRLGRKRLRGLMGLTPSGEKPPRKFRFCFVRHPLSWYESYWRFNRHHLPSELRVDPSPEQWQITASLKPHQSDDFNEWMDMVAERVPGFVSYLFRCYAGPSISAIGRTENLRDDLGRILRKMGCEFDESRLDLPAVNVSASAEPQQKVEWDPQLRDRVQRLELPALAAFGYFNEQQQHDCGLAKPLPTHPALLT
jgi:hypothetical protein